MENTHVETFERAIDILVKEGATPHQLMIGLYNSFAFQCVLVENNIGVTEAQFRPVMNNIRDLVKLTEDW